MTQRRLVEMPDPFFKFLSSKTGGLPKKFVRSQLDELEDVGANELVSMVQLLV